MPEGHALCGDCLSRFFQLSADATTAVDNANHHNGFAAMIGDEEHKIIVQRHDAQDSFTPLRSVICTVSLRHLIEESDCFFQTVELTRRFLNGLKAECNMIE